MTYLVKLLLIFNVGLNPKSCDCNTEIVFEFSTSEVLYLKDSIFCDKNLYYFIDSFSYIINISDCMGSSVISKYDKNNLLISTSYFSNSIDTLADYGTMVNYLGEETSIYVYKYFKPLKNGIWLYFTQTGGIEKREIYSNGILLATKFE